MKNLLAVLSFITVCMIIGAGLVFVTDDYCEALAGYDWIFQLLSPNLLLFLLKSFIFTLIGICLFWIIRRFLKSHIPKKYNHIKIVYFALLPIAVFHHQFALIPQSLFYSDIKDALCSKTTRDGMFTMSEHLNLKEYQFLQGKLLLLPDLPETSDSINVTYFTDNFLGDFMLNIDFVCGNNELIDTTHQLWKIVTSDANTGKMTVSFYDYAD